MGKRQSAGLLMYRISREVLEVFIAHPGGPKNEHRDEGVWSIPKGEFEAAETPFETALREFHEETGISVPQTAFIQLGSIQQAGGKIVHGWAFEGSSISVDKVESNLIEIEWPKKSGTFIQIPEIDRAEFFPVSIARKKLKSPQVAFIDRLEMALQASE